MDRRRLLASVAGVTVIVRDGQVWRALGQGGEYGEGPAFEPWKTWRLVGGGPLVLVRAAILSANAFNTQPWRFRTSAAGIEVFADPARNLGAFDPYLRELHLSLGCAIENAVVAALPNGYRPTVELVPGELRQWSGQAGPELVARVHLERSAPEPDLLYDAIPHRHTNRAPFRRDRPLPAAWLSGLASQITDPDVKLFLFSGEPALGQLVDLVVSTGSMMADPEVQRGTRPWFRPTSEALEASADGVEAGPPLGARQDPRAAYRALLASAPAFGILAVRDRYERAQTLEAGRAWQRLHLAATARGIAGRPANGPIEMIDHERRSGLEPRTIGRLGEVTGEPAWQPTFMFYLGYPTIAAAASVRRKVRDVLD